MKRQKRQKPLERMSPKELEAEATKLIKRNEPLMLTHPELEERLDTWQLSPVERECDCGDCDACAIAEMFLEASGAVWRERFERYAWAQGEGKAEKNRDSIAETRASNPAVAKKWRESEREARHDDVNGPRIRARDKIRKRDARLAECAHQFLFDGDVMSHRAEIQVETREEAPESTVDPTTQLSLF